LKGDEAELLGTAASYGTIVLYQALMEDGYGTLINDKPLSKS